MDTKIRSRKGEKHRPHRRQHELVCQHCGAAFLGTRTTQKFCRRECGDAHWDATHREERRVARRERFKVTAPREREHNRKKYWENPERARAKSLAWIKTEVGRQSAVRSSQKRRAIERNAPGDGFTVAEFFDVCADFEDHCVRCLRKFDREKLSADHVVPLARGGHHSIENIQPMCRPCNSQKHARTVDYRPTFWWRGPSRM